VSSFSFHRAPPALHSFPTRRSSDLFLLESEKTGRQRRVVRGIGGQRASGLAESVRPHRERDFTDGYSGARRRKEQWNLDVILQRSEEHTSELQSRSDLVCRLLLEKK